MQIDPLFKSSLSMKAHQIYKVFAVCAEGMLGENEEAKKEFEILAQQEMEVWKNILSGSAVMEHMEDKYHDMLKV